MRFLVSNDDGVEAAGLRALAESLAELGEVTVCAPDREQSATSRSISLHRPLRIEKLPPWGAVERWAVDGTPTDAVYIGLNHVLKARRPDVVASGINRGPNLANDVHYPLDYGTVMPMVCYLDRAQTLPMVPFDVGPCLTASTFTRDQLGGEPAL